MLNAGLHEFNEFTPITAARALYLHVLQITDNINKFKDYSIAEHQNQNGSIMHVKDDKKQKSKMLECYNAWKAHAKLGNSYKLILRMDSYVKELLKEVSQYET